MKNEDLVRDYVAEKFPATTRTSCSLTHVLAVEMRCLAEGKTNLQHQVWHEVAKQALFNVYLLFNGELQDPERSDGLFLPCRLSAQQRKMAQEHFLALWAIIVDKRLEPTPAATARGDSRFQRFMHVATSKPKRRRRG